MTLSFVYVAPEPEKVTYKAKYRLLVEHAKAGFLKYDYNTNRIVDVNDEFAKCSGYSKEELLSMDLPDKANIVVTDISSLKQTENELFIKARNPLMTDSDCLTLKKN